MAEKIISPGVFTNEIDQSFLPAAVADIGAALIGPTLKGPAGIPTIVTSYSDFQNKFGDVFKSGSNSYQYLTSHAAESYLKNSDTLTVVRIMDGDFSPATTSVTASSVSTGNNTATASLKFAHVPSGSVGVGTGATGGADEITIGGVDFTFVSSSLGLTSTATQIFVPYGAQVTDFADDATVQSAQTQSAINFANAVGSSSIHGLALSASAQGNVVSISGSSAGTIANLAVSTGSGGDAVSTTPFFVKAVTDGDSGGLNTGGGAEVSFAIGGGTTSITGGGVSFVLKTIADGTIVNNASEVVTTNNILVSGSKHNLRYEVTGLNNSKGTFTLLIRRGDDSIKRKQTVETYNGVSLDPNSPNFIAKAIGDQVQNVGTDENGKPFLQLSGSYPNKSKFVTVESIETTIDYIDENGNIRVDAASASLPAEGSGSGNGGFLGGTDGYTGFDALGNNNGTSTEVVNFYEDISTQSQGLNPQTANQGLTAYEQALDLLSNQDEYDINLILAPGIIDSVHTTVSAKIIDVCESRADCFAIIDPVVYGKNVNNATERAEARDSNFAAMYWPWVKVP